MTEQASSASPTVGPTTDVDPRALTAYLDAPYAELSRQVRADLVEHAVLLDQQLTASMDESRELVKDVVVSLAQRGHAGRGFPRAYGGGEDVGAMATAFQNLAYGDLSVLVKTGVQFGLFGGAILHLGTERHHDAYLRDLIGGALLGCFGMTEVGHGSNVQQLETTATYDADTEEFVVHSPTPDATKTYIGNAARHARLAVVFAQLVVGGRSHGVHALVVPVRDAEGRAASGVTIGDNGPKLGLKGVDNGTLAFDHVRVPRSALLNRYGDVDEHGTYTSPIEHEGKRFFTMLGTLVTGRVCVSGGGLFASRVALTIATRYATRRRQFGAPGGREVTLMTYKTHQRKLLPLIARTYALSAAQRDLIAMLHDSFSAHPQEDRRVLEARAAGQKALATWHATETIQVCREACGGAGYMAENRFAALKADTDVFTTFEGDNTVLLQLVAKGLLTEFRQSFNELDQAGMVRFVANQAMSTVLEKAALRQIGQRLRDVVPVKDDDGGLLDPGTQRALLRWREEHIRGGLARRIKRGVDDGRDAFDVFTECQDHVVATARASVERSIFESFDESIAGAPEEAQPLLRRVCDLHALATIEADRAWFLEHGRISTERAKAIQSLVGRLCGELAPYAETLCDGFDIPEELLRAPIATPLTRPTKARLASGE